MLQNVQLHNPIYRKRNKICPTVENSGTFCYHSTDEKGALLGRLNVLYKMLKLVALPFTTHECTNNIGGEKSQHLASSHNNFSSMDKI